MEVKTKEGTMRIVKDAKTTIEDEKLKLIGLEELIAEDKKNNDKKSLEYHTLALEETKRTIKELERN